MLGFIVFELSLLVGLWAAFITLMTFHRVGGKVRVLRWWKSQWQSQLIGIAVLGLMEAGALVYAATGHEPPLWIFIGIFGAVDIITARWLYLIWKARKTSPSDRD